MESFAVRAMSRLRSLVLGNKVIASDNNVFQFKEDLKKIKNVYSSDELTVFQRNENKHRPQSASVDSFLRDSSAQTTEIIRRNKNLTSLIPELIPAQTIWETSIISPVDNQTNSLGFSLESAEYIDEEVRTSIEEFYDDVFNKQLDTEELILKAIRECLFGGGAFPVLILPQQNVNLLKGAVDVRISQESLTVVMEKHSPIWNDESIPTLRKLKLIGECENYSPTFSMESINTTFKSIEDSKLIVNDINILGEINNLLPKDDYISLESLQKEIKVENVSSWVKKVKDHIVVSNNPHLIASSTDRVKKVIETVSKQLNVDDDKVIELFNNMFNNELSRTSHSARGRGTIMLSDEVFDSNQFPIITEVPPDCVIPVGTTNETIGYYILTDNWVTPMSKTLMTNYDRHFSNDLVDLSVDAVYGVGGPNNNNSKLNKLQRYTAASVIFDVTLNKLLEDKLEKMGFHGMTVARHQMISRCLFHHLLQEKEVGLIFVPKHLMVYYAVDYREDGTGKSLLENIEHVLSMRSTLLVSKLLAETRAAVEKTKITVDVTDNVNYLQTLRIIQNAFYNKNSLKLSNDPDSIVRNIHESRVSLIPKNLKGAPEFSVETEPTSTNTVRPSDELLEYYNKAVITGTLVPRSGIEETENTDYATSLASRNLHFNNVARRKRDIFLKFTGQYVKTISIYSSYIKNGIKQILKDYYSVVEDTPGSEFDTSITDRITDNSSVGELQAKFGKDKPKEETSSEETTKEESDQESDETNENDFKLHKVINGPLIHRKHALFTMEETDENDVDVSSSSEEEIDDISKNYVDNMVPEKTVKGKVIGSKRRKITDEDLNKLCAQIIYNIRPTLPSPNVIKNKSEFEEINSYIDMVDKIVESVYPENIVPVDDGELKNYFAAIKAKLKRDNVIDFMSRVGKQELFKNDELDDMSYEWHSDLMQSLMNGSKYLKDKKKVLTPTPEGESGDGFSSGF